MTFNQRLIVLILTVGLTLSSVCVYCNDDLETPTQEQQQQQQQELLSDEKISLNMAKMKSYSSPRVKPEGLYMYESFDDEQQFKKLWLQSQDPKYEGKWQLNSGPDRPHPDLQLLLPHKARHYAISSKLNEPFKFSDDKPLIVQYEVQFREGLDCGGAYVKLLRQSSLGDLNKLNDKTPYSIMFGPDKCGSESKLHFITQYLNPKTQEYSEKHWKQAKYVSSLMAVFSDKKHHLFRLVLEPSGSFEIFLDNKSVGKGNLLEDVDPPINPPKEIVDPNDKKPADWDERAQIDDPDAKKPDDWDEDAPKLIEDPNATKPNDWLENEPKYIRDPNVNKPDDWEEMDGEWEAPLIDNPACAEVSGCGEWKAPMINNPNYKGKWKPAKIDNPNYKGKWAPRNIPNPDYFYDDKPFSSLDPIGGVAFELWSMSDNIAFDNIIVTNDRDSADLVDLLTWREKKDEADARSASLITKSLQYLQKNPWSWIFVILGLTIPLILMIVYCCESKNLKEPGIDKKTDPEPSMPQSNIDGDVLIGPADTFVEDEDEEGAQDVDDNEEDEEDNKEAGDKANSGRQVRQRKK